MSKKIVSAIYGFEPPREGELPTAFILGGKHNARTVTSITHETHNYGDHGIGWYIVKSGDDVIAEVQERVVAEVYYKDTTPAAGQQDTSAHHGGTKDAG